MPTILIIEKDFNFLRKLSQKISEFGYDVIVKTQLEDPDELLKIQKPVDSLVLNFELENMEGLSVYSYIKNSALYDKTNFTFIADDENIFSLLSNIHLDNSIILNKEEDINFLVKEIINNVPLHIATNKENTHNFELSGELGEDFNLQNIIDYCIYSKFSGRVVVNSKFDFAIIVFEDGSVSNILYKEISIDNAIRELSKWKIGNFRIERKKLVLKDLVKNIESDKKNIVLSINDLFSDLFYFLHSFLETQLDKALVENTFLKCFPKYKELAYLTYFPDLEEKVVIKSELTDREIKKIIKLIKDIFISAQQIQPEIVFTDFEDFIHEIEPYLKQINFYEIYKDINIEPANQPNMRVENLHLLVNSK